MFVFESPDPKYVFIIRHYIMELFKVYGVTFSEHLCSHMQEDRRQWLFCRPAMDLSASRLNYLHPSQATYFRRFVYSCNVVLGLLILHKIKQVVQVSSYSTHSCFSTGPEITLKNCYHDLVYPVQQLKYPIWDHL